jgi:hypothetical protein
MARLYSNILVLLFILLAFLVSSCEKKQPLTLESLKNGRYYVKEWDEDKILWFQFGNGKFTRGTLTGSKEYLHIEFGKAIIGDFSGDGIPGAIVLFSRDAGGSGSTYTLALVVNRDGKIMNVDSFDLTGIPDKLAFENGIINVELKTWGPDDANCCPSVKELWKLKISNDKIVKVSVKQENENKDINLVKNGTLPFDKTITVGNVLDNYEYFTQKKWVFDEKKGRKIVVFRADFDNNKLIDKLNKLALNNNYLKKEIINKLKYISVYYIIGFYINVDLSGFSIAGSDVMVGEKDMETYREMFLTEGIYKDKLPESILHGIYNTLSYQK